VTSVTKDQKFTADNPCPVCNGYQSGKRGTGERCYGFYSADRKYVNCTRDEFAGSLQQNSSSNTYSHYMVGRCNCGTKHTSFTAPAMPTHSNVQRIDTGKQSLGDPVAVYTYDSGSVPFEVHKFVVGGDKTFRQCQILDGKRVWNLNGVTTALYHQSEVENAELNATIWVTEGEKDVDELKSRGLVATCNPMGAGKWREHFNETFNGRTVVVIADHDVPGDEHAEEVATAISPVAQSVKVLRIPDLPDRGDVSDFLQAGGTIEQLIEMVESTPVYVPTESATLTGGEAWADMQPLPAATPTVPTLPADLLPEPLREWLVDVSERAPVPLEFVALPALSGLGSVIGRQVGIQPEQFDDYTVVPNLWGAIIGRSGKMKTHAVSEGLRHVRRLETEAAESYDGASANREAEQVILKAESDNLNAEIKKALSGTDTGKVDALQLELTKLIEQRDTADAPARRFLTQDATVEKLGVLLKENPRGLLIFRDELSGWLQTLEKAGREGEREFYLEAWNGTGSFSVDRIGRGLVRIPALTLTICGSIQPGKLKRYIAEAIGEGAGADGLLQRVQLLVWPDESAFPVWGASTEWGNKEAKHRAWNVYKRLSEIELPNSDDEESNQIPALHFTPEAQVLHTAWRSELEHRLRTETVDTPAFESHISKYRSLAPALALVYYLAELEAGEVIGNVPVEPLKQALAMCDFLEMHARKVFAPELNPGLESAYALSRKIQNGTVHDGDTVREIYRHGWTGLAESQDAFAAVEVLERYGWVRLEREGTGGRTKESLSLHPELEGKSSG
jgi:hypothetical protein